MINICDFQGVLKTEFNLKNLTRTCRIKIYMTLKEMRQTRRARLLNVNSGTFKFKGERSDHMLHYEQVFRNVFEKAVQY